MNRDIEIAKRPFRIQGTASYCKGTDFHRSNKAYATFEEAANAAAIQSCNSSNRASGNRFIVYKAIAIVGPTDPPAVTTMVEDIPF
jgi:hypothetical protein